MKSTPEFRAQACRQVTKFSRPIREVSAEKLAKAREEIAVLKELVRAQGKALGLHAETADNPVPAQD